jgi:AcrR family transcriptional regulator
MVRVSEARARRGLSRDEILTAALDLGTRRGVRTMTLGDLADSLGVTRQAIYYYFDTKEDVVVALFSLVFDEVERAVEEARSQATSPVETFRQMVRAHAAVVFDHPAHLELVLREQRSLSPSVRRSMTKRRQAYQRKFESAFADAARYKEVADLPPDLVVSLVLGTANAAHQWTRRVDAQSASVFAERIEDLFANGYGAARSFRR